MSNLSDAQVYARQLLLKHHGYPLWVPEPYGNSVAYRTKGVRIGDIGYVTQDGAFETLFNVRAPSSDPINCRGVPEGFEQVSIPFEDIVHIPNFHQADSIVTTASTKRRALDLGASTPDMPTIAPSAGMTVQFDWTSSQGAILHLPDGASRLTSPAELFRDVAIRGAKNWYKFANVTLRRGVPNGALYLVTGCDKTSSWMVGSFSTKSSDSQVSFKLSTAGLGNAHVSYSYLWDTSSPAVFRTGSSSLMDSTDTLRCNRPLIEQDDAVFRSDAPGGYNQCVFLRGYRLMLRNSPMSMVLSGTTKIEVNSISSTNPKDIGQLPVNRPYAHLSNTPAGDSISSDKIWHHAVLPPSLAEDSLGKEVLLEHLPDALEPYHPSILINKHLLQIAPNATVSLVHDDEWSSVINQGDIDMPTDVTLISRILEKYECSHSTAATFLVPRKGLMAQPHSHLSNRQTLRDPTLPGSPQKPNVVDSFESCASGRCVNPSSRTYQACSSRDAHSNDLANQRRSGSLVSVSREYRPKANIREDRRVVPGTIRPKEPKRPKTAPSLSTYVKHEGSIRRRTSFHTLSDSTKPPTSKFKLYVSSVITVQ